MFLIILELQNKNYKNLSFFLLIKTKIYVIPFLVSILKHNTEVDGFDCVMIYDKKHHKKSEGANTC